MRQRVLVQLDENGVPCAEHLPEPRPRAGPPRHRLGLVFEGMLQEAGA
nr:Uncharacterised protein [Klebsiella pneumoniae]